ncbi:YfgM family protein [Thermithiobacillus plumbiphilus]|uniref:Ancillary SecYEG translocon subunit n=1 Tax=Thermithiobacillus plumbiphilus TaxID=1729899 RepID=A0ABU9DD91_9PROT
MNDTRMAQPRSDFSRFGIPVLFILILAVLAGGAYWAYENYQTKQNQAASTIYSAVVRQYEQKNTKSARQNAEKLVKEYDGTTYAALAGFYLARMDVDAGQPAKAVTRLEALRKDGLPTGFEPLVALTLARVHLTLGKPDEALKDLQGVAPAQFAAEFEEMRGDAYMAQNKPADARKAYAAALSKLEEKDPYRAIVQLKLDDLGGAA